MPEYKRAFAAGGTFFFTVVTYGRRPILTSATAISHLREAFLREMHFHPFKVDAIVILPDHMHCIWTLPAGDARFSMRWSAIKGHFTRLYLSNGRKQLHCNSSRATRGEQAVWQRRFWEHVIRDDRDYQEHMDYIHYNPVRHGHAECPHGWPHSSFRRFVQRRIYAESWQCACRGQRPDKIGFDGIADRTGE